MTTIVPLRPYNAPANILPEQTLGRGLRRMTPPAAETTVHEIATVVEHPAFASLYRGQLHQEGLEIAELDADGRAADYKFLRRRLIESFR